MFETLKIPAMTFIVGPTPVETGIDYTLGAMYSHNAIILRINRYGYYCLTYRWTYSQRRRSWPDGIIAFISNRRQANSLAVLKEAVIIIYCLHFRN